MSQPKFKVGDSGYEALGVPPNRSFIRVVVVKGRHKFGGNYWYEVQDPNYLYPFDIPEHMLYTKSDALALRLSGKRRLCRSSK